METFSMNVNNLLYTFFIYAKMRETNPGNMRERGRGGERKAKSYLEKSCICIYAVCCAAYHVHEVSLLLSSIFSSYLFIEYTRA